jgi:hypothetical protein
MLQKSKMVEEEDALVALYQQEKQKKQVQQLCAQRPARLREFR